MEFPLAFSKILHFFLNLFCRKRLYKSKTTKKLKQKIFCYAVNEHLRALQNQLTHQLFVSFLNT